MTSFLAQGEAKANRALLLPTSVVVKKKFRNPTTILLTGLNETDCASENDSWSQISVRTNCHCHRLLCFSDKHLIGEGFMGLSFRGTWARPGNGAGIASTTSDAK